MQEITSIEGVGLLNINEQQLLLFKNQIYFNHFSDKYLDLSGQEENSINHSFVGP